MRPFGENIREGMNTVMTNELIKRAVNRYSEEAKKEYGTSLYRLILFGSCARGDYDNESDVDIMILLDIPREQIPDAMDKAVDISCRLNPEFNYDILFAPIVESKDVFLRYKKAMPFFENVVKEGIEYV